MARDFDLAKLLTDSGLTITTDVVFDTSTLFIDSDNNRVGIITTTPSYSLDVNGVLNTTSFYIGGTQVTSTATELNLLDGVTATTTEINYLDGVTSNIQTQIDNISSSFTISDNQGTPNTDTVTTGQTLTFAGSTGIDTTVSDNQVAIAIDSTVATLTGSQTLTNKTITSPSISNPTLTGTTTYATLNDGTTSLTATVAELNYTDGVTSNIQTQLNAKIEGNQTITLSGDVSGSGTTSIAVTIADDSHNHIISNVDGLQAALDLKAPLAGPAFTGTATAVNLTLSGNLTVNGTTTTLNTTNTVVSDNLIELNNGATSNANDSGIVIERGTTGDNAFMGWDESADTFVLGTTTATGSGTGDLTITPGTLNVGTLQIGGTSVTATAAELNILDGVTATASELNALDGITATVTELNYTDGVTSNIQTQLDAKLASSSYTAADVLTKIKTVDGAGSGLDADLLDGISSASFLRSDADDSFSGNLTSGSTNWIKFYHPTQTDTNDGKIGSGVFGTGLNIVGTQTSAGLGRQVRVWGSLITDGGNAYWHDGNDGASSGLDADLLDGVQGASYLRSDADDIATGQIQLQSPNNIIRIGNTNNTTTAETTGLNLHGNYTTGQYAHRLTKYDHGGGVPLYVDGSSGTANIWTHLARFGTYTGNGYEFEVFGDINATGNLYDGGNAVWHAGNDGSGSGLDADLLDGQQGSYYQPASTAITNSGTQPHSIYIRSTSPTLYLRDTDHISSMIHQNSNIFYILRADAADDATWTTHQSGTANGRWPLEINISDAGQAFYIGTQNVTAGGQTVWHAGNDGASSGLDADLLDGQQGSYYLDYNNLTNVPSTSSFPAGTIMLFQQTAAPTGWTKITTHDNKALRVISGTVGTGGTQGFTTAFSSWSVSATAAGNVAVSVANGGNNTAATTINTAGATLTNAQLPSHAHVYLQTNAGNYNATISSKSGNASNLANISQSNQNTSNTGAGAAHSHNIGAHSHNIAAHSHTANATFTGSSHSHSFNLAVAYVDVIFASKN